MRKTARRTGIIILFMLAATLLFSAYSSAEETLSFPEVTETECVWDESGKLISETVHDPDGAPAVNSRGYHRAAYTWDDHFNLLSESYYGLDGQPVNIDKGYARAVFTYYIDQNACSSSRIVVWFGRHVEEAKERFWKAVSSPLIDSPN